MSTALLGQLQEKEAGRVQAYSAAPVPNLYHSPLGLSVLILPNSLLFQASGGSTGWKPGALGGSGVCLLSWDASRERGAGCLQGVALLPPRGSGSTLKGSLSSTPQYQENPHLSSHFSEVRRSPHLEAKARENAFKLLKVVQKGVQTHP